MKKIALLFLLTVFTTAAFTQTSPADDRQAVLDAVDRLWAGMKAKSAEQIKAAFMPDGQLLAVDKDPKNPIALSTTRMFTGEQFAKLISEAKVPGDFIETMIEPEVKITGDLALVTGRYTFYVGDKFSHCGIDTFNLVRTAQGWKIANGASTLEFSCDSYIKAVKVPTIAADPKDVSTTDGIIKAFYEVISGPKGQPRQWSRDRSLYIPGVRFVSMSEQNGKIRASISNHQQYVESSNEMLVGSGFTEREINRVMKRYGNIAHIFSTYEFSSDDGKEKGRGINSIELFWDGTRWWISAASWDDERANNPLPKEYLPKGKK
jgi:hypothetical protein